HAVYWISMPPRVFFTHVSATTFKPLDVCKNGTKPAQIS
ncbi:MAG: hypothetical protein ACI97B_001558, partial [Verrucomicrobiales bacterium]